MYIEGVPIKVLVNTGAQSTIISRATLHRKDASSLHFNYQLFVSMEKNGPKGSKGFEVTAPVSLNMSW